MPLYQCASPIGLLTEHMKPELAQAITDAHVAATGAPREFVHVVFTAVPEGAAYSAGQLDTTLSLISGSIRTGRSIEVKQQLVKTIVESWSQITGPPWNPRRRTVGSRTGPSDVHADLSDNVPTHVTWTRTEQLRSHGALA